MEKCIGPQHAITSYQRWQVVPASPSALHTHAGAELMGEHVVTLLNELDRWMRPRLTHEEYAEYTFKLQELMTRMVVAQVDEVDDADFKARLS